MTEFILEDQICNVKNARTRDYLREIVSTYQHGDYRSCIVTLYVVTVYDLLERIRILDVMYGNSEAHRFMEDFKRKTAPGVDAKYSDLEKEIIQEATNLQILTDIGKRKVEELRTLRHDCAHPSIDAAGIGAAELYMPNRDEVRAKIRTMFELLFLKDPSVMKTVLNGFDADLLQVYQNFGEERLQDYLLKTYYHRMTASEKELLLNSSKPCSLLWNKAFFENEDKSNENRRAYFIAIRTLIKSDREAIVQYICDNPDRFFGRTMKERLLNEAGTLSDQNNKDQFDRIDCICGLLFNFPKMKICLPPEILAIIEGCCERSLYLNLRTYFLYDSMAAHADVLKKQIPGRVDIILNNEALAVEMKSIVWDIYQKAEEFDAAALYHPVMEDFFFNTDSKNYVRWNRAYDYVLSHVLPHMDEEALLRIWNRCKEYQFIPDCFFYYDSFLPDICALAEKNQYYRLMDVLKRTDAGLNSAGAELAEQ